MLFVGIHTIIKKKIIKLRNSVVFQIKKKKDKNFIILQFLALWRLLIFSKKSRFNDNDRTYILCKNYYKELKA